MALAHLLIALSRVYPLSRRGLGYINDLRLSVSPSVRQSVIRLCPLSFSNIPLSETVCRTHDSATQTQGQGHSSRSWDLPSNIVSAPYLQPELLLFDGVGSSNIVVTCDEVESVLKALPIGKATGPDGINNCILIYTQRIGSRALTSSMFFIQSIPNLRYRPRHLERSTCVSYSKGQLFQTIVLSRC